MGSGSIAGNHQQHDHHERDGAQASEPRRRIGLHPDTDHATVSTQRVPNRAGSIGVGTNTGTRPNQAAK